MFGSDGSPIVQYVVIFAVIFTALAAIVFVVRRLTGRGLALPGRANGRGRQPRLGIVDVYELDRARQLILLRRDNVEHLLLVGGPNDVVVERNIQRGQRPLPEAVRTEPVTGPIAEPLPDPLAGAGRLPEPPLALSDGAERRSEPPFAPGFAMPVVVPSPVPGSGAAPPVTLPLDAGLLAGDEPGQDIPVPKRAPTVNPRSPAPSPPRSNAAVREPFSARRILGRTAPPALDTAAGPATGRRPDGGTAEPRPDASQSAPPLAPPSARREVDPAILSDMARQLQAALARPASAVAPAPAIAGPAPEHPATEPPASVPLAPKPSASAPSPGVDPVAAAMAAAVPAAMAAEAALPAEDAPPPAQGSAPPPPKSAPRQDPEIAPAPQPSRAPPVAPVAPSTPPAAEPAPKAAGNPFSVEEIEAEFARLLGRPLDKRG